MASTNNEANSVNQAPAATVNWPWHEAVCLIAFLGDLETQEYVQQCAQRLANGEPPIFPTPKQLELLLAGLDATNRELLIDALKQFENFKIIQERKAMDESTPGGI